MFRSVFGRRSTPPQPQAERSPEAIAQATLLDAIERERANDPLIAAKICGKEILQRLLAAARDEHGVHVQTLLATLGGLAGFACQMSIREALCDSGSRQNPFAVVQTSSGQTLFFGDALNGPLAESSYSVWALAAGAAQRLNAVPPDLPEMFRYVTSVVGSAAFGIPRCPEGTSARPPMESVKALWPAVRATLETYCKQPVEWPVALGISIQEAIVLARDAIDPAAGIRIAMESAIAMSKIDPKDIGVAYDELNGFASLPGQGAATPSTSS